MTRQLFDIGLAVLAAAVIAVAPAHAAQGAGASAHWKGAISLPQAELEVEVDLVAPKDGAGWTGTISTADAEHPCPAAHGHRGQRHRR